MATPRKRRRTAKGDAIMARRAKVARLLVTNPTQRELGAMLGVSRDTINKDVKALREAWQREARGSIGEHLTLQLARLEVLWEAAMERLEAGETYAIYAAARVLELRARLLGLNAGERVVDPWAGDDEVALPAGFDRHQAAIKAQEFLEVTHGVRFELVDDDAPGDAPGGRKA